MNDRKVVYTCPRCGLTWNYRNEAEAANWANYHARSHERMDRNEARRKRLGDEQQLRE